MFKYIILGVLAYWILKRVFKISAIVKQDGSIPTSPPPPNPPSKKDNIEGEYVDYEEIE